jgi:SAM-dependent methyltransferase
MDLTTRPLDPRAYALLAEAGFGPELFNPQQHRCCELTEQYALAVAVELVERLGVTDAIADDARPVEDIVARLGFVGSFARPLRWLLDHLAAAGLIARDPAGAYRRTAPLPPCARDAIRSACLAGDPSYASALALIDEAAAAYPRVARGETTGERALFMRVGLWAAYFSNTNRYYALNNRVTARAVAARLPRASATIVEVGAGLGSGTEALLEAIAAAGTLGSVASYRVTEPVPFFRRRAERALTGADPAVPFTFAELDMNRPWSEQGVARRSANLVWGVNVFHLARDLDGVLREARSALVPGGWLVIGEGLRPAAEVTVGTELPFQILESFADVPLDAATRPTAGFLTAEHWRDAFRRAGFDPVEIVPDAIRLRAYYLGLLTAAVCGQRRA